MEATTNKNLAIRFTEEKYAKKEDVRRDLKMTMIDSIWASILQYRSPFSKIIPLMNLNSVKYFYCYAQQVKAKLDEANNRFSKLVTAFTEVDDVDFKNISELAMESILTEVGIYYGEPLTKEFVRTILKGQVDNLQGISKCKKSTNEYYKVLNTLVGKHHKIDPDFLVSLYVSFSHNESITTIYRNFNFKDNSQVINRTYTMGAPFQRIEKSMNDLFAFLNSSNLSPLIKANTAFYYINYIKPFDDFNQEIAMLVFKTILSNDDKEQIGYYLPLESLLNRREDLDSCYRESERGLDLTYVLLVIIQDTIKDIDKLLNIIVDVKTNVLRREHISDIRENLEKEEKPLESLKIAQKQINVSVSPGRNEVAIPNIEAGLDEKDALKFEKYLLEKNPLLKPSQAHFYARHCTIGSFYTIQMFKKIEKVVYETARTSMEALTSFGYYEKRQIKNKFVYTPIKLENR